MKPEKQNKEPETQTEEPETQSKHRTMSFRKARLMRELVAEGRIILKDGEEE